MAHVNVRGQLVGMSSLLLPCELSAELWPNTAILSSSFRNPRALNELSSK